MGKILKHFKKENVSVKLSRQRSEYGGWEYAVWVEIEDKKDKGYGYSQDPDVITTDLNKAKERFAEIEKSMKEDLKFAVHIYAPQIEGRF